MIRRVLACTFLLVLAASAAFAYTPPTANLIVEVKTSTLTGAAGSDLTSITPESGSQTSGNFGVVTSLTSTTIPTSSAKPKIDTAYSTNWVRNTTGVKSATDPTRVGTGYTVTGSGSLSVANGFTFVTAVRPEDYVALASGGTNIRSIIGLYNNQLCLGMMEDGSLRVRRVTGQTLTSGVITTATTEILNPSVKLDFNVATVLSMVVQSDGSLKVWSSASTSSDPIFSTGSQTNWANGTITSLLKGSGASLSTFSYGSYPSPAQSSWHGLLGDTYVYQTAFDETSRLALVDQVKLDMGMTAVPEPTSIAAILVGLCSLAGLVRRKR